MPPLKKMDLNDLPWCQPSYLHASLVILVLDHTSSLLIISGILLIPTPFALFCLSLCRPTYIVPAKISLRQTLAALVAGHVGRNSSHLLVCHLNSSYLLVSLRTSAFLLISPRIRRTLRISSHILDSLHILTYRLITPRILSRLLRSPRAST